MFACWNTDLPRFVYSVVQYALSDDVWTLKNKTDEFVRGFGQGRQFDDGVAHTWIFARYGNCPSVWWRYGNRRLLWRLNCPICCAAYLRKGRLPRLSCRFWRNIRKRGQKKRRRRLFAMWRGCCRLSLVIVTALGILAAPLDHWASAPGFAEDADKFQLSINLLRITFPLYLIDFIVFFCWFDTEFLSSVQHSRVYADVLNISLSSFAVFHTVF